MNLKASPRLFPDVYQLLKVNLEDSVSRDAIAPEALSQTWHENLTETREIGDTWLAAERSALLLVPSAAVPESFNYLLNPVHPDAKDVVLSWRKQIAYDKRLFLARS